jgi:hypothetical protein
MRYRNSQTDIDLDLSGLDADRLGFFKLAIRKFRENVSWLEFEAFAFAFTSPVFLASRNRKEVLRDPLYLALKDMWLQLGIRQGFVAERKEKSSAREPHKKARKARPNRASRVSNLAPSHKPRVSSRRSR